MLVFKCVRCDYDDLIFFSFFFKKKQYDFIVFLNIYFWIWWFVYIIFFLGFQFILKQKLDKIKYVLYFGCFFELIGYYKIFEVIMKIKRFVKI